MNKIVFHQTSNIFVNTGIVALHRYINKYSRLYPDKYVIKRNELEETKLIVECDNLLPLLEDVYYFMGNEIYDTATTKQLEEAKMGKANYYYDKNENKFYSFPKMNTYGLTHLFTNNAQGVTRNEENSMKLKNLENLQPGLALKFKKHFQNNGLKESKKIYFNEPYTKITRISISEEYFESGNHKCPVLNEGFKKLVESKNVSPFVSGLSNFNSFLHEGEKKISLKALYLIRFSPAMVFYHYSNGYDTLICNFFNSNNLKNIDLLCNPQLYKSKIELENQKPLPFSSNFKFFDFTYTKKDNESYSVSNSNDAFYSSEITFLILYTFYKRNFEEDIFVKTKSDNYVDPFSNHPLDHVPVSMISFKAEKFASTMRPNDYEEYNNVKFIFRLIYELEHGSRQILIKNIWSGLKIRTQKSKALNFDKSKLEERKIRAEVFKNILRGKSIALLIEKLFYESYNQRLSNNDTGYRNYGTLLNFLLIYEQTLKSNNMDKELQNTAINLGTMVGQGILRYENGDKLTNAKSGRKYLINLHKSRTLQQFLDAIYRIANKYGIAVSKDILKNIDEENFLLIRQFVLISALNQLNSALSSK